MVITETRLTEKLITDEEGAGLLLPRIVAEKPPEVECRRLYVLFADVKAQGHIGSGPVYALLVSRGKATKPRKDEFRERVGTESLRQSLELTEVQGMFLWNLGTEMMSRWRFDMRTHLAVTS